MWACACATNRVPERCTRPVAECDATLRELEHLELTDEERERARGLAWSSCARGSVQACAYAARLDGGDPEVAFVARFFGCLHGDPGACREVVVRSPRGMLARWLSPALRDEMVLSACAHGGRSPACVQTWAAMKRNALDVDEAALLAKAADRAACAAGDCARCPRYGAHRYAPYARAERRAAQDLRTWDLRACNRFAPPQRRPRLWVDVATVLTDQSGGVVDVDIGAGIPDEPALRACVRAALLYGRYPPPPRCDRGAIPIVVLFYAEGDGTTGERRWAAAR